METMSSSYNPIFIEDCCPTMMGSEFPQSPHIFKIFNIYNLAANNRRLNQKLGLRSWNFKYFKFYIVFFFYSTQTILSCYKLMFSIYYQSIKIENKYIKNTVKLLYIRNWIVKSKIVYLQTQRWLIVKKQRSLVQPLSWMSTVMIVR